MGFILIIVVIISIVIMANTMKEYREDNKDKYLSVKDKINFDLNMLNFKKHIERLENNKHGYTTQIPKNYKFLFDKIYAINLKETEAKLSFKSLKILESRIDYYIQNKKKLSDISSGYRAEDSYYEILNEYLLEFNNEYYPSISNLNIEGYFELLCTFLDVDDSREVADKIGLNNSNLLYTNLKNINYLFLRQDISIEEKEKLENIIKKKIIKKIS